jgi:predicted NAD-dependent protein-ADP-ribosyltransferase YbiA (DUF1768 family)/uncharacterized protein (DUF2164 family)
MVVSKLNNDINYLELKIIHEEDIKKEADLYEIDIDGVEIIIAVGNAKNFFSKKNITYFPIYLVKNDNNVIQIGLYEVLSTQLQNYLDDESNLIVEKMDDPLIYSFVTKELLENLRLEPDIKDKDEQIYENDVKNEIPDFRKDIFTLTQGIPKPRRLTEETKTLAKEQREKYTFKDSESWVETFMENPNYYIVDNEGNGDCLFATVRDGFAQIGQQTTVQKLRKKLAEEATQELFMNYKQQYENAKLAITKDTENIKELEIQYNKYRKIFSESLDRNEKKQAIDAAKKLSEERERVINEKRISQQIANEFEYMKDINSLDQFKKKITTCEFWGETWALSTMERILRIKFILLSEEAWKDKDTNNVVVCGQLNDRILEQQGEFKPDYYFILDFNGYHYKLVGYKKKQIYTFQEIPYDIKKKVAEKCMEKNAGVFSLIPDFIAFQKELNAGKPTPTPKFEELSEAKIRGLYDDDIQFVFYKSSPHKIPGQGNNEKLSKEMLREFSQLASIKNWRKKLDNTWLTQFTLDGHQWNSVEHYYQGSKFKGSPDFYLSFTAESGTKLSKDPELAKASASTSGKLKGEQIRPKEVTMDSDLTGKQKEKSLRDALEAKFMQDEELKQLLKLTKRAKLLHYKKSKDPELAETLMFVRDKLNKATD